MSALVFELSELERAALGIEIVVPESDDPEVAGFHYVAPDGTALGPASLVEPPQVIHDERIVQLGPLTPVLPTRWHRTAKWWKPAWLTVRVDPGGEIELIMLGGPVLCKDRVTEYADSTWEHWGWRVGFRAALSPESHAWPEDAPEFVQATVRWLLDADPRLTLPEKG